MGIRQSIQIYHPLDIDHYLAVLKDEFGARYNPYEAGAYLIDAPPLPFYQPRLMEQWNYTSILSFNWRPLSPLLLTGLATHPDLVPPTTRVRWLEEQELLMESTVEGLSRSLFHHKEW